MLWLSPENFRNASGTQFLSIKGYFTLSSICYYKPQLENIPLFIFFTYSYISIFSVHVHHLLILSDSCKGSLFPSLPSISLYPHTLSNLFLFPVHFLSCVDGKLTLHIITVPQVQKKVYIF